MRAQVRRSLVNGKSVGARPSFGTRLGDFKAHLAAWLKTCADYSEAAAMYEQLSNLSDAELRRRGLTRATLASDVLRRLRVNRGEMSGMRRQRPDPDPMRKIDLLLMEEIMMRRNFPTNARTRAVQTLCMLVVLAALTGMFIHALTHRDATSIVSVPALSDSPNRMPTVP